MAKAVRQTKASLNSFTSLSSFSWTYTLVHPLQVSFHLSAGLVTAVDACTKGCTANFGQAPLNAGQKFVFNRSVLMVRSFPRF